MNRKIQNKKVQNKRIHLQTTVPHNGLTMLDYACILLIIAIYSIIALYHLGDTKAPQSGYFSENQADTIVLDMGGIKAIGWFHYYTGCYSDQSFKLEIADTLDSGYTVIAESMNMQQALSWDTCRIYQTGRYIRLTSLSEESSIFEFVITDTDDKPILPVNSSDYPELFDEGRLWTGEATSENGAYFDEILYAGTAYEFLHGLKATEWTHPPLGKIIIAVGMQLFGTTPFGWRIAGTLFGIAMLPVLYLFAKRMVKETWISAVTTILFAFDFMHFTQTRIATIDVFVTFFILCMYYFMYCYLQTGFYDSRLPKALLPLGLCGISMGLAIACKWTGFYAGAGLAVLFFRHLYLRYREYRFAKTEPAGRSEGLLHQEIVDKFIPRMLKTLCFCLIFFVVIPCCIYLVSYLPFHDGEHTGLVTTMLDNQKDMFSYHTTWEGEHNYSSRWYEWPTMVRPMLYDSMQISDTIGEGITAFGNPLVWWAGIPAAFLLFWWAYRRKDKTAGFLLVAYLAQYLPWLPVQRITYIYHYFPSVPFVVLMLGYLIYRFSIKSRVVKRAAYGYAVLVILLFVMFYPVISGQPVNTAYVDRWLRWFDGWVFLL